MDIEDPCPVSAIRAKTVITEVEAIEAALGYTRDRLSEAGFAVCYICPFQMLQNGSLSSLGCPV